VIVSRRRLALGLAAAAAPTSCESTMTPPRKPDPPFIPPAVAPAPRASLRSLLAANRTRDPEFGNGLSNHQSMALGALAALGADEETLAAFADRYSTRLRPLRDATPLASADFRASIGSPAALVELIRSFETALAERGRNAVLKETLPSLVPGVCGGAFHGLIRTAYALDVEDDAELAHALAYFVTVAVPLRPLPSARPDPSATARELFARAASDTQLKKGFEGTLIVDAMRSAAEQPGVDELVAALRVDADTLDDLAGAALDLYVHTLDFTALHAVTSTHALRLVLPKLAEGDQALSLRYHFQALLVAALSIRTPQNVPIPGTSTPDWASLATHAVRSTDDHDEKFVFTCREEARLRTPDAYRAAAAQRLGLA
jgi:hypothetical protein